MKSGLNEGDTICGSEKGSGIEAVGEQTSEQSMMMGGMGGGMPGGGGGMPGGGGGMPGGGGGGMPGGGGGGPR